MERGAGMLRFRVGVRAGSPWVQSRRCWTVVQSLSPVQWKCHLCCRHWSCAVFNSWGLELLGCVSSSPRAPRAGGQACAVIQIILLWCFIKCLWRNAACFIKTKSLQEAQVLDSIWSGELSCCCRELSLIHRHPTKGFISFSRSEPKVRDTPGTVERLLLGSSQQWGKAS